MTLLKDEELFRLLVELAEEAIQNLDQSNATGRQLARQRLADSMRRNLLARTLIRMAQLHGIRGITTAKAAAAALAGIAISEPTAGDGAGQQCD